jgi:diacylglycerol kinase (ATP)
MQWDTKEKIKKSYQTKTYKRPMSNYFSIGVESRIGLGFEKNRSNHHVKNKIIYGWEGLKKMCCCCVSTSKIRSVVDYVSKVEGDNGQEKIMFKCQRDKKVTDGIPIIRGNPVSLVCTNINSMMGG